MKKKILALAMVVVMVLGIGITSHALTSSTVTLTTDEYSDASAVVGDGKYVTVYAKNYSDSAHKVHAITFAASAGGSWFQFKKTTLDINTVLPSTKYTGTSTYSYFLELNPNLTYKNCHAYGTIKVSD